MLLTLNASAVRGLVRPDAGEPEVRLSDLPEFARDELGLHGLTLPTDLLAGADRATLTRLRERADKSGCACLVLTEGAVHDFDAAGADAAVQRMTRVVEAASVLGCNAASVRVADKAADPLAVDRVAANIRKVVDRAERLEVNLLISPAPGFTSLPDELTELIKKIGGFRIGTLPDFQDAVGSDDAETYLRRLTPYASAVNASTVAFEESDEPATDDEDEVSFEDALMDAVLGEPAVHTEYDLAPLVRAVIAVGYDQTLALDYRGEGDPRVGLAQSRSAIEGVLDAIAEES